MTKLNVAVVFGGFSSEHEVSISSAVNIINNLSKEKYNIIPVYINSKGSWFLYEGDTDSVKNMEWEKFGTPCQISCDMQNKGILRLSGDRAKRIPIDVAFPVLHGKFGEDGTMQGLFEIAGIKYVGCKVMASAIAMDKGMTKNIASALGINQAKYLIFHKENLSQKESVLKEIRYKIGYPCFVKPARGGSSVGISKAKDKKSLEKALDVAFSQDDKIIVEKAIIGREFECSVLGDGGEDTFVTHAGEILAGAEFYDYDAKYNSTESKTVLSPDISVENNEEMRDIALKIFRAIGATGMSRVDFFVEDETGGVVFNEINTIPGFTDISMYPKLIEQAGIPQPRLMDRLIEIAMK